MIPIPVFQKFLIDFKRAYPESHFSVLNLSSFLTSKLFAEIHWPDHLHLLGATNVLAEEVKTSGNQIVIDELFGTLSLEIHQQSFRSHNKNFPLADVILQAGKKIVKEKLNDK